MTCNFGPVAMGTAIVVQTPVVANGVTGEEVVADGTSPGGETVELDPIEILNPFIMDMHFGGNTNLETWDDLSNPTYVDTDIQWSLRLGKGSDPGPEDDVTYRLRVTDVNSNPVNVGTHPTSNVAGCSPFDRGNADGHPWSRSDIPPEHHRNTSFVDTCTLTPVTGQAGIFDLDRHGTHPAEPVEFDRRPGAGVVLGVLLAGADADAGEVLDVVFHDPIQGPDLGPVAVGG